MLPTQHERLAGSHVAGGARARRLSVCPMHASLVPSLVPTLHEGETGVLIFNSLRLLSIHTSHFYWGFAPNEKSKWNKWKNHFSEMKGDVGMSLHEKEREQEDVYTKTGSH